MSNSSSVRVLLVEDSAVLAGRIAELIRGLPRVDLIDTVDTEAAALERMAVAAPDVLILDLHLRSGSGFGVLRSLGRTSAQRPKVIVLTGFDLPQYRRNLVRQSRSHPRLNALTGASASRRHLRRHRSHLSL